jgi:hypothetical protein
MDTDRDTGIMNPLATQKGRDEVRRKAPLYAQGRAWKKADDLYAALDGLDILETVMRALEVLNWMHDRDIHQGEYKYWMTAWRTLDQARARYAEWRA